MFKREHLPSGCENTCLNFCFSPAMDIVSNCLSDYWDNSSWWKQLKEVRVYFYVQSWSNYHGREVMVSSAMVSMALAVASEALVTCVHSQSGKRETWKLALLFFVFSLSLFLPLPPLSLIVGPQPRGWCHLHYPEGFPEVWLWTLNAVKLTMKVNYHTLTQDISKMYFF